MRMVTTTKLWAALGLTLSVAATGAAQTPEEKAARRDQLRIAVQEICPVSGQKLGSMGPPVKVAVGEAKEEVFLCCKGCLQGKIKPEHWATIHANIARAQGKCPVMKNELPDRAKWTVVDGEVIYVCCPPCIEKLQADPEPYLKQVDAYYTAYLEGQQRR